jgi:adenine/guanine phosphoribosyltransferase-like PRPP-binding protein
MQKGAIKPGQNVIVIDDLIATGSLQSTYFSSKPFLKKR